MTAACEGYLRTVHLSRTFEDKVAVDDLTLDLRRGELFVLLGPSGCGKTTMLRLLAGLESPSKGEVFLDGRPLNGVPPGRRNVAMVFQDHALYPHMRVADNLGFGLRMQRLKKEEIRKRVAEVAGIIGLEDRLGAWPHQLSGGEAQRVALGKALIRRPDVLLLDEPLSNLDAPLRRRLREEILRLQRKSAITTVYVTHDQEEGMALGDRMGILQGGRLLQVGTPRAVYENPGCVFAAEFLGSPSINLIPAELLLGRDRLRWPMGAETQFIERIPRDASGSVWIGIRPEDVLVSMRSKSPPEYVGRIEFIQDMGFESHLVVSCGGLSLRARCAHLPEGMREGVPAYLKLRAERMLLFRRDTGERVLADAGETDAG
ncbi:MAG: ABC transporter ATP-binding protein [bacterium]